AWIGQMYVGFRGSSDGWVDRWLRRDHHGHRADWDIGAPLSCQEAELVVGLPDVLLWHQPLGFMFTLGFEGDPQVVVPAPHRIATPLSRWLRGIGSEQQSQVGESAFV